MKLLNSHIFYILLLFTFLALHALKSGDTILHKRYLTDVHGEQKVSFDSFEPGSLVRLADLTHAPLCK